MAALDGVRRAPKTQCSNPRRVSCSAEIANSPSFSAPSATVRPAGRESSGLAGNRVSGRRGLRKSSRQRRNAQRSHGHAASTRMWRRRIGRGRSSSGRCCGPPPWKSSNFPVSCLERLSALVPDLVDRPATTARSAAPKTASDRYQLFDAVRTLLQRASSRALVVLILDDLHQADPSSLLLLEFVARELSDSRLLLVATYRADEMSTRLMETMGELARVGLQKVVLTGLGLNETGSCWHILPATAVLTILSARSTLEPAAIHSS